MDKQIIFLPALALVLLTALIWCWMYYTRIKEICRKNIPVQDLADTSHAQTLLKSVSGPSDNLKNLFEMPVLFYAATLTLYVTELANYVYLTLASLYVVLRYAHSLIHVTYNNVMHRFTVYFLSTLVLWAIWIILAAQLIGRI